MKPIVASLTTTVRERGIPTYVEVEPTPTNGLRETSFIVCHELATIPREMLGGEPIGRLDLEGVFKLRAALMVAIGAKDLPPLPR